MRAVRLVAWGSLMASAALVSCSWSRFSEVSKDAPVVVLTKPGGVGSGYASTMAAVTLGDEVRLLVGPTPGLSGAAEFVLGTGQSPTKSALTNAHCRTQEGCSMAATPSGLSRAESESGIRSLCFAEGYYYDPLNAIWVVELGCKGDGAALTTVVPWPFPSGLEVTQPDAQRLATAAERVESAGTELPRLLVGLSSTSGPNGTAFVYRPGAFKTPEVLAPGVVGPSYGRSVAIFASEGATYFAVGEPDVGKIHVFRDDNGTATLTGCVERAPGFGQTLAAGRVFPGNDEDLAVADGKDVIVFPGGVLTSLPNATCADVPEAATQRLACRDTADVTGCGGGHFGASLAVADFDADGDGEVVVGAPGMSVRDESSAGAVEIFDLEGAFPLRVTDVKFISSAESGDRLGTSLAIAHQPDRDVLVAGGPGGGKAAVFMCSKLLPPERRGARCQ
jgi:hypothetical protein